jgi:hypothetical protein
MMEISRLSITMLVNILHNRKRIQAVTGYKVPSNPSGSLSPRLILNVKIKASKGLVRNPYVSPVESKLLDSDNLRNASPNPQ